MKIRNLALLIPFAAAACDNAPTLSRDSIKPLSISYESPVTAEGYLDGADGFQLFYRVYGSGPDTAVVLAGGPALPISYLEKELAPLAHGRTVIFYDARGAGFSQLTTDPAMLGMDRHVADVEAVRQHFGLGKMKLVGHSWGAMVAGYYAAAHPRNVDRMVMVTPGPIEVKYDAQFEAERIARTSPESLQKQGELIGLLASGQAPDPVATCEQIFTLFFPAYFYDASNAGTLQGKWCGTTPQGANLLLFGLTVGRMSLGPNWNLAPMLEDVRTPTLVIHGQGDPIPFASTAAYAHALPNGELRTIDGAGHFPWMEQPAEFFAVVNNYLRRRNL
jgi:proline iminopeptidase